MSRITINEMLEQSRAGLRRVTPREALRAAEGGALLVDTRSAGERAARGSVPAAVNMPLSVLEWRIDPDSGSSDATVGGFDRKIILLCAEGYSSSLAAARLQALGFPNATDVIGGFEAWLAEGLPVE
jgi:rhodanese-related sulfurtransferase